MRPRYVGNCGRYDGAELGVESARIVGKCRNGSLQCEMAHFLGRLTSSWNEKGAKERTRWLFCRESKEANRAIPGSGFSIR